MIKQELLDLLACPKCKGPLEIDPEQTRLVCRECSLCYPIRDGIPVMLVDEATPLAED